MDQLNPYQASQLTKLSHHSANIDPEFMADALGPNWLRVCSGAKLCGNAVSLVILSVLFTILGMIIIGNSSAAIILLWVFQLLLLVSAIMQSVGLSRLREVSERSGAKRILRYALIFQVVLLVLTVGSQIYSLVESQYFGISRNSFLMAFGGSDGLFSLIPAMVGLVYNILTYVGLRRIGVAIENRKVRANSAAAIATQCVLLILAAFFIVMLFVRFGSQGASSWGSFVGGGTIVSIVVGLTYLVMLSFYSSALRYISNYITEYAKLIKLGATSSPSFGTAPVTSSNSGSGTTPSISANIPIAESAES